MAEGSERILQSGGVVMNELFRLANRFHRRAGLLKVPEQALKEAEDFIVGKFCSEMADKIATALQHDKNRVKIQPLVKKQLSDWETLWGLVEELKHANPNNPDELRQNADKIVEFVNSISKIGLSISSFDRKTNSQTGMMGNINSKSKCANFFILKNDDSTYYFHLYIKFDHTDLVLDSSSPPRINIDADQLTPAELRQTIIDKNVTDHMGQLYEPLSELQYNFDTLSSSELKNMAVVYGHCKRWADNSHKGSTFITVSFMDLPGGGSSSFSFVVELVDENGAENVGEGNNWSGLWSERDKYKSMLGTVYVKTPKLNASDMINLSTLNDAITALKKTTRHEVQHFVQTAINRMVEDQTEKPFQDGGLPSRKVRDTLLEPNGRIKISPTSIPPHLDHVPEEREIKELKLNNLLDKNDPHQRVIHTLRDIEFYTRLSDEIAAFNQMKNKYPLNLQDDLARVRTALITPMEFNHRLMDAAKKEVSNEEGSYVLRDLNRYMGRLPSSGFGSDVGSRFFQDLKEHQPLKWRKAVSEFFKAVGN